MASQGSGTPPALATWAELDPGRYPFDPVEAAAFVPTAVAAAGTLEPPTWTAAIGSVLADRFGPWAYGWDSGPGTWEQRSWGPGWMPPPAEVPDVVTGALLAWRRWLEKLAERFDRFLPLLDPAVAAGPGELVAAWESAIAELMRVTVAPVADDDNWQGWCRGVLRWFLTATGVSVGDAAALVDSAVDRRFDNWVPLTAADVVDSAERLTRGVLEHAGTAPAVVADIWPDTWPQDWPTWRATNTTGHDSGGRGRR